MNAKATAGVSAEILALARRVRLLVLDVDGVLTDGRLYYDAEGRETKSFHVRDGYGLQAVRRAGIEVAVISGRSSPATATRMHELGIRHVLLGRNDKLAAFEEIAARLQVTPQDTACVGDDLPDLPVLELVALPIAVADAHPAVHSITRWCTRQIGGNGAVREVCDLLLAGRER